VSDGHVTQGTARNLTGVNGMGRVLQVRLFFADEHFSVTVEAPPQAHRVNATYIMSCRQEAAIMRQETTLIMCPHEGLKNAAEMPSNRSAQNGCRRQI